MCLGNICRSPLGEAFLRGLVDDDSVRVASAGTSPDGSRADRQAIAAAARRGYDISDHRPQGVTRQLLKSSDLVVTMEAYHKHVIARRFPEAIDRVFVLQELANELKQQRPQRLEALLQHWQPTDDPAFDVADPWGHSDEIFDACADEIHNACVILAPYLVGKRQQ